MKTRYLIASLLVVAALAGCKNNPTPEPQPVATENNDNESSSFITSDPTDNVNANQPAPVVQHKPIRPAAPRPVKAAVPARPATKGEVETIYVETDGAQGRVWGHVTMQGDRGTGTIHDWDENTLAVSVTRHGNELFAVDQNSRQYVFKLKQNKSQE